MQSDAVGRGVPPRRGGRMTGTAAELTTHEMVSWFRLWGLTVNRGAAGWDSPPYRGRLTRSG